MKRRLHARPSSYSSFLLLPSSFLPQVLSAYLPTAYYPPRPPSIVNTPIRLRGTGCPPADPLTQRPRRLRGNFLAGHSFWRAHVVGIARVHRGGDRRPGPGHRRQHGDLQRRERGHVATPALPAAL